MSPLKKMDGLHTPHVTAAALEEKTMTVRATTAARRESIFFLRWVVLDFEPRFIPQDAPDGMKTKPKGSSRLADRCSKPGP